MKITIITSYSVDEGGQMFDAALVPPPGMDLNTEKSLWDQWYAEVYCKSFIYKKEGKSVDWGYQPTIKFHNFVEHLIKKGARHATDDEVTVFAH